MPHSAWLNVEHQKFSQDMDGWSVRVLVVEFRSGSFYEPTCKTSLVQIRTEHRLAKLFTRLFPKLDHVSRRYWNL